MCDWTVTLHLKVNGPPTFSWPRKWSDKSEFNYRNSWSPFPLSKQVHSNLWGLTRFFFLFCATFSNCLGDERMSNRRAGADRGPVAHLPSINSRLLSITRYNAARCNFITSHTHISDILIVFRFILIFFGQKGCVCVCVCVLGEGTGWAFLC